jgi:hypothetical protein
MSTLLGPIGLWCQLPDFGLETSSQQSLHFNRRLSGRYEFSLEMCEFLWAVYEGEFDSDNTVHLKCLKIASRKSCYNPPLYLDGFAAMSDIGYDSAIDARIIRHFATELERKGKLPFGGSRVATRMDHIIPWGTLTPQAIRMLNVLWKLAPEEQKPDFKYAKPVYPETWHEKTVVQDGTNFLLLSSIRSNTYARLAAENLIKFGLVDLTTIIPKDDEKRTKGRLPVGICISPTGIRFYTDYLKTYNMSTKSVELQKQEITAFEEQVSKSPEMAKRLEDWRSGTVTDQDQLVSRDNMSDLSTSFDTSDISDIDNGENLKDLFG